MNPSPWTLLDIWGDFNGVAPLSAFGNYIYIYSHCQGFWIISIGIDKVLLHLYITCITLLIKQLILR